MINIPSELFRILGFEKGKTKEERIAEPPVLSLGVDPMPEYKWKKRDSMAKTFICIVLTTDDCTFFAWDEHETQWSFHCRDDKHKNHIIALFVENGFEAPLAIEPV